MMHELEAIVFNYDMAKAQGKKCALATVVGVLGSSYRRPGARMLITDDGQLTGAISGGCLEGDALKKALHVIRQQTPSVQTYDTMDDDDAIIGIGLGCKGIVKILIEPIDVNDIQNPIELIRMAISQRVPACLVTLFYLGFEHDAVAGTKFVLNRDQFESNAYLDFAFDHDITSIGKEVIKLLSEHANTNDEDEEAGHYADKELAYVYLKTGDREAALKHALAEFKRRPANIEVNELMAWVHYQRKEYPQCIPYLEQAMRLGSKNPVLLCRAGLIYCKNNQSERGVALLREAVMINPYLPHDHAPVQTTSGSALPTFPAARPCSVVGLRFSPPAS